MLAASKGGTGFALTTALKSRITFAGGAAVESNFFNYRLLKLSEMPQIVPVSVKSERPAQGFGEVVLAPVAPALAAAVLASSGRRLDTMPFPGRLFV